MSNTPNVDLSTKVGVAVWYLHPTPGFIKTAMGKQLARELVKQGNPKMPSMICAERSRPSLLGNVRLSI